jgi:hypothetical protein
LVSKPNSGL